MRAGAFTWTVLVGYMKHMTGAPSGDAPLAHERRSARARHGGGDGPKSRVRQTLWSLLRVAIAVVTLVVSAGIASHGQGSAGVLAAAFDVVAAGSAIASSDVLPSEPVQQWHDGGDPCPAVADLDAVELGDDDDDDSLRDVFDVAAPLSRSVPAPREPERVLRDERRIEPSRFAAGPGLPRGPPV